MTGKLGAPPPPSSPAVSKAMKGNRGKNTGPELELRRILRAGGYVGYRLHWAKAPGHPDLAFPGRKVAIFVNGCYWHQCPVCKPAMPRRHSDFWTRKFELNRERDARKNAALVEAGWQVLTVWECELNSDSAGVLARIGAVLDAARHTSHTRS